MPQRRANRVSKCSKDSLLESSANAAPQSGPTAVDDTAAKPQPALKPEPAQTLYKFPLPRKPRAGVLPRSASMRGIYSCASSGRPRAGCRRPLPPGLLGATVHGLDARQQSAASTSCTS
ncbi:hypothetical protein V5799_006505 [Amblyomma americanum]|uniref:Uncharacterized protein n=1 Tax=Amblyomma americanum TaxID=6943 RepID=A0AAQ4DW76_AMBAM